MSADGDPCPGAGKCHGCLKWCDVCGDVAHICDDRLDGRRCDEHPVPPEWGTICNDKAAVERKRAEGRRLLREVDAEMDLVNDAANARRAYDKQRVEQERLDFAPAPR